MPCHFSGFQIEMVGLIESVLCIPSFSTIRFLGLLTIIQFWWIAVWGIAYLFIAWYAGKSKQKELWVYLTLLFVTLFVVQMDPSLLHKL